MNWRQAHLHATRYANEGHETMIHVGAQGPDATVKPIFTVRILRTAKLDSSAVFEDSKRDCLEWRPLDLEAGKYFELR
jgi:hypothetical protein